MNRRNASFYSRVLVLLFAVVVCWLARPAAAVVPCLEGELCPVCGDAICDVDELCPEDCNPSYGFCGDGTCNGAEDCSTCADDCGICPPPPPIVCGNNLCQTGETCSTCPGDCGTCPPPIECGNNICEAGESCSTCSLDCGECPLGPLCGNALCEAGDGETCQSCSSDCGECDPTCNPPQACGPICGNRICEHGETCSQCAGDCGACWQPPNAGCNNNRVCNVYEVCSSTCLDCCGGPDAPSGGPTGGGGYGVWGDRCDGHFDCAPNYHCEANYRPGVAGWGQCEVGPPPLED